MSPPPERLRSRALWPWFAALLALDAAMQGMRLVVQLTLLGQEDGTVIAATFNSIIASHNEHLFVDRLLQLSTWVMTLAWAHRMWSDVAALRPGDTLAFTPRQAVRGFFIPFYNIVHPWKMFSALRQATLPFFFPVPEVANPRAGYRDAPTVKVIEPVSSSLMLGAWYTCTTLSSLVLPMLDRRQERPLEHLAPAQALGLAGVLLTIVFTRGLQAQLDEQHRRAVAQHHDELPPAPRPLIAPLFVALPMALGVAWFARPIASLGVSPWLVLPVGAAVALPLLAACALALRWLSSRHASLAPRFGLVAAASVALLVGTAVSTRHLFTAMNDAHAAANSLYMAIDQSGDELRESDTPRDDLLASMTRAQAQLEQVADSVPGVAESFRCNGRDVVALGRAYQALKQALEQAHESTKLDIITKTGLEQRSRAQEAQLVAYRALADHFREPAREQVQRCLRDGHAEPEEASDQEVRDRLRLVLLFQAQSDLAARYQAVHQLQLDDLLGGSPDLGARREALHQTVLSQVSVASAERAFAPPQPSPEIPSYDDEHRGFTTAVHLEPLPAPPPPKGLERTSFKGPLGRMTAYSSPRTREPRAAVLWLLDGEEPDASLRQAAELAGHGVAVMVPLLRGWEPSPGRRELMLGEIDDLEAARAHLSTRPDVDSNRIVVVGRGLAGSEAMLLASRTTALRAVVAIHPLLDADELAAQLPAISGREAELRSPSRYAGSIKPFTWMLLDDGDLLAGDALAARFATRDGPTSRGPLFAQSYTGEPMHLEVFAPNGKMGPAELAAKLATMPGEPSWQGLQDEVPLH